MIFNKTSTWKTISARLEDTGLCVFILSWNFKVNEKFAKDIEKHKPTNVGRIALDRQARQFNSGAVA